MPGAAVLLAAVSTRYLIPAHAHSLRALFQQVAPSVAVIETKEREPAETEGAEATAEEYTGSAFLISADGKMMTAAHVVQVADEIRVKFRGSETVKARVIASDPAADVALLQLDHVPPGARVARLGDADRMEVGDEVIVVGAPLGVGQTMTWGHISGRHSPHHLLGDVDTGEQELLQTDAAISPGNSGGPMFNRDGEVVGIVSFILSESGNATPGLSFVVTSNLAKKLLLEEKSAWTGVEGYHLKGALARGLNLPQPEGILVERIAAGSPAQRLGLRPGRLKAHIDDEDLRLGGDAILAIQGIPIGAPDWRQKIRAADQQLAAGAGVRIDVLRAGHKLTLESTAP